MVRGLIAAALRSLGFDLRRRLDSDHDARPRSLTADALNDITVLPDRDEWLRQVPPGGTIVEVGVGFGDFTRRILDLARPAQLVAVDLFSLHTKPRFTSGPGRHVFGGSTHEAWFRNTFRTEIDAGRLEIVPGRSDRALDAYGDGTFDLVYLDADHTYAAVCRDLAAVHGKVRPGGLLACDDYERADPFGRTRYGVKQAVHEFCLRHRWPIASLTLESASSAANIVLKRPEP
jgi:SAM-dependent methyltransferase